MPLSYLQIFAILFGLFYIYFATKNKPICFLFGAISCLLWAIESYFQLNLKFDALLQIVYVFMSIYGAHQWLKGNKSKPSKVKNLSYLANFFFIILGILISFSTAYFANMYFDIAFPYLDALTTGFSLIATYLLTKRYIENWLYWLIINPVYFYIYYKSGAPFFAGMSLLYMSMSILGYFNWRKELAFQLKES